VTPRISPRYPPRPMRPMSSFEEFRSGEYGGDPDANLFWKGATVRVPQGQGLDPVEMLDPEDREAFRVLSKATAGAGGNIVPADMYQQIVSAARTASAVARVALEIVTAGGAALAVPDTVTHGAATWTAENVGYTASDEVFGAPSLGAFKAAAVTVVSEELVEDAVASFDEYLSGELGAKLGQLEETAFCQGDGSGKPLGLVHSSSPYTVVTAATGSATSFKLADLAAAFSALPSGYRANASWLLNGDDFVKLAALVDSSGGLVLPSLQGPQPSLFGRPVFLADLPAPAANAKSAVVGDFSRAYAVRRVQNVGLTRLVELYSNTGQQGYKAFERVDGRPILTDAARILQHSAT
jgi:HK97 family phage major capsid protein